MSGDENDITISNDINGDEYYNGGNIGENGTSTNGILPDESHIDVLIPTESDLNDSSLSSPESCPLLSQLSATEKTPTLLRLKSEDLSGEIKTPTNAAYRHSFGDEPRSGSYSLYRHSLGDEPRSGSLESSGSDLQRAIFERLPSFHLDVPGHNLDFEIPEGGSYDFHKTPTNYTPETDSFPSPTLRIRRSFPRSRPVSGDPLSNYNVIPRRKDSFFAPHLLKYGEFSDSEDDRSVSVTTSYLGDDDDDDEDDSEDEDCLSDLETTTARSLYFMAYEVKRRLSTVPAESAGTTVCCHRNYILCCHRNYIPVSKAFRRSNHII